MSVDASFFNIFMSASFGSLSWAGLADTTAKTVKTKIINFILSFSLLCKMKLEFKEWMWNELLQKTGSLLYDFKTNLFKYFVCVVSNFLTILKFA